MPIDLQQTDEDLYKAVGDFVVSVVGSRAEVIQGFQNEKPLPVGDCVIFTPLFDNRLAENSTIFDPDTGTQEIRMPSDLVVQLDAYGDSARYNLSAINAMWRDQHAFDVLAPFDCEPLYSEQPHATPIITDANRHRRRWTSTLHMAHTPKITTQVGSATEIAAGIYSTETLPE